MMNAEEIKAYLGEVAEHLGYELCMDNHTELRPPNGASSPELWVDGFRLSGRQRVTVHTVLPRDRWGYPQKGTGYGERGTLECSFDPTKNTPKRAASRIAKMLEEAAPLHAGHLASIARWEAWYDRQMDNARQLVKLTEWATPRPDGIDRKPNHNYAAHVGVSYPNNVDVKVESDGASMSLWRMPPELAAKVLRLLMDSGYVG